MSEIDEAVQRGYPTAYQRNRWTCDQLAEFYNKQERKHERERANFDAGDSNARLRQLVDELLQRVDILEQRLEALQNA